MVHPESIYSELWARKNIFENCSDTSFLGFFRTLWQECDKQDLCRRGHCELGEATFVIILWCQTDVATSSCHGFEEISNKFKG